MIKKALFRLALVAGEFFRKLADSLGRTAVRLADGDDSWNGRTPGTETTEQGENREINELRSEMLTGVLEMGETVAREIMIPRTEMVSIEAHFTRSEVLAAAIESEHSRIPVYETKVDNIIGVLYSKDLLKVQSLPDVQFDLRKIVHPAYFIPETKPLALLLREFQRNRVHMAIVVDEYGGVAGIVTLEDILEEIIGEIQDEYDQEEERVKVLDNGDYLLDARLDVESVEELLGIEIEKGEFESLGGWVTSMFGHLPRPGENFSQGDWRFIVDKATERKVVRMKVKRIDDGDNKLHG
jgi:CBS domain containing-hemolysin-like protein